MKRAVVLLIMLVWAPVLHAGEVQWFDGYGEAVAVDTLTVGELKQEALEKARRAAVERAVGVMVQGDTLLREFVVMADFTAALSTGHILEEKIVRWDASVFKDPESAFPVVIYKVFLKARVAMARGVPDPAFKIRSDLNRSVFKDGDSVSIKVKSTKDCYLHVFIITERSDVYLILPNRYNKGELIRAGEEFIYPSQKDIERGLTLKAGLMPGMNKTKEFFRVLATMKPIDFPPGMFKEGIGLNAFSSESGSLGGLLKEIVAIPADQRTDSYIPYEVVKK